MAVSEPAENETVAGKGEPEYFVRFRLSQRVEHAVLMVSFTALAVTGLAEKFYTFSWAEWMILRLVGIEYVRLIHRGFGVVFTLGAVYHLSYLAYAFFVRRSKPSIVPNLNDARNAIDMFRYSFGFADKPPRFDRFDYRQKFEYWGMLFGGIAMIITGLFLTYPLVVTRLFPGQFVAAAREAHGNEAMLATITILIWHLYDTIFKPGIFPADLTIFTGRIPRKRMMEEHPLEYAEAVGVATDETAGGSSPDKSPPDPSSA